MTKGLDHQADDGVGWHDTGVPEFTCSVAISKSAGSVEDVSKSAAREACDLVLW